MLKSARNEANRSTFNPLRSYEDSFSNLVAVVVVVYPTPSEGWGHGGRPWSPRSRATLQGLDQRSYRDRESPKSERRRVRSWTVQNEMRGVLGRVSTGAAGRILNSAILER